MSRFLATYLNIVHGLRPLCMTFATSSCIFETSERSTISNRKLPHSINHLISRVPSFHEHCFALLSVVENYEALKNEEAQSDDAKLRKIEAWAERTCTHKLHNVDVLDRKDGLYLADLAMRQADRGSLLAYVPISLNIPGDYALIPPRYLHLAKPRTGYTAFSVAFVTRLLSDTDPLRARIVNSTFDVILEFISNFLYDFSVDCRSVAKRGRSGSDMPPITVQCLMSADDVAILLVLLDVQETEIQALELVRKLEAEAGKVDVVAFESFFLPLLKALIVKLPWTPELVNRYKKLFRTTLLMYARRYVQIEPQGGDWTDTPRGCGWPRCPDCPRLDQFLVNASQQSLKFPVSRNRRQHLHQRLDRTNIKHDTDRRGGDTLVVTKLASPSLAKHEQWQKRFSKAEERIQKLDQTILKQLLDDDYEYLTELRDTRRGREGLPSARVAVRGQGPEIIDLT